MGADEFAPVPLKFKKAFSYLAPLLGTSAVENESEVGTVRAPRNWISSLPESQVLVQLAIWETQMTE